MLAAGFAVAAPLVLWDDLTTALAAWAHASDQISPLDIRQINDKT
jgi:hypothetical protein